MKRHKIGLVAALMAVLAVVTSPAGAHDVHGLDPDDVAGNTDIEDVLYRHEHGMTTLKMKVFDGLHRGQLSNGNQLEWALDTVGNDAAIDFRVFAEYRPGAQRYRCFVFTGDSLTFIRRVDAVKRPFSLKCTFSNDDVQGVAEHFAGAAYFSSNKDFAPDAGVYNH